MSASISLPGSHSLTQSVSLHLATACAFNLRFPRHCARQIIILIIGRIAELARYGLLLQTELRGLSVCMSVATVSPAKTAKPIEIPFGTWTQVDLRNYPLDGVQIPNGRGYS